MDKKDDKNKYPFLEDDEIDFSVLTKYEIEEIYLKKLKQYLKPFIYYYYDHSIEEFLTELRLKRILRSRNIDKCLSHEEVDFFHGDKIVVGKKYRDIERFPIEHFIMNEISQEETEKSRALYEFIIDGKLKGRVFTSATEDCYIYRNIDYDKYKV